VQPAAEAVDSGEQIVHGDRRCHDRAASARRMQDRGPMTSVLVLSHGHTFDIAKPVAASARVRGLVAVAARTESATPQDLLAHDAIVVIVPTYFGRCLGTCARFLRDNADFLSSLPTVVIAVSRTATPAEPRAFLDRAGVRPRLVLEVDDWLGLGSHGRDDRIDRELTPFYDVLETVTRRKHVAAPQLEASGVFTIRPLY